MCIASTIRHHSIGTAIVMLDRNVPLHNPSLIIALGICNTKDSISLRMATGNFAGLGSGSKEIFVTGYFGSCRWPRMFDSRGNLMPCLGGAEGIGGVWRTHDVVDIGSNLALVNLPREIIPSPQRRSTKSAG